MSIKEQTQKVVKTFTTFWESQDKKRKILYIALLVLIIIAAIIVTALLNKKEYVVLYENLETSEASAMVSLIEDMGYEAKLSNGTITVLKGTESNIAMQLAMQKYPRSSFEYTHVANDTGMFTTEAQFKAYDKMDTENRLRAAIKSLENIRDAVVFLTDPVYKGTVIPSLRVDPTAAVTVYLDDGVERLSNKQIAGITHLVKNAWPGLTDENISIMDGMGIPQIESVEWEYDEIVKETKRFKLKTDFENSIKNKILEMLIPVYGEDGVSVAVNSVLDFDRKVSETTDYSPEAGGNSGVLQHADATNASGGTTVDGGVVGVEYNADDTYPTGNTNGTGAWSEESLSNTYLVDTYKEQAEKDGYDVEALSIGVIVYRDYLSEAEKQDLMRLVAKAGPVDPAVIEDFVTVTNFAKFTDTVEDVVVPRYLFGLTFDQLILVGAIVLILIVVILIVMAMLSNSAKKKRKAFEQQIIETSGLITPDGGEPEDTFMFNETGEPVEVPSLTDDSVETKEVVIRREISEFAKYSPEIVAQLLKNWMKEEED